MWPTESETRAEIIKRYQQVCEHADATTDLLDLDSPGRVPWWPRPEVRMINVTAHVVAETNRHAGHADIPREQLDGATGVNPAHAGPVHDAAWWRGRVATVEAAARRAGASDAKAGDGGIQGARGGGSRPGSAVVVANLEHHDVVVDEVHQPVLPADAPRPAPGEGVAQRFGLADPVERVAWRVIQEPVDALERGSVRGQPVRVVRPVAGTWPARAPSPRAATQPRGGPR